jgi:hypothetical protein
MKLDDKKPMTKTLRQNLGAHRIWDGKEFCGTTVLYAITEEHSTAFQCDFHIDAQNESHINETRAYRENLRKRNMVPTKLGDNRLWHEAVVLFGPEMTPKNAVAALRRLADEIEQQGMLIGRVERDGDFAGEATDGSRVM